MTTEQMDWLDDERAGRHTTPEPWKTPVIQSATPVPAVATDEPAFVEVCIQRDILPRLIQALHVAKNLVTERAETATPAHPLREDVVQLHALIRVLKDAAAPEMHTDEEWAKIKAEREKAYWAEHSVKTVHVNPEDYATMAEEPPEHRDRRQWLDGYLYGFREGFERAGWRRP